MTTPLPPITSNTSHSYVANLNDLTSRPFFAEPLVLFFIYERLGVTAISNDDIAAHFTERITRMIKNGGTIVESGGWAAAAMWEPPSEKERGPPPASPSRPISAKFHQNIAMAKRKHMGQDAKYYRVSMMARAPGRTEKGAIRAIIEPYVQKASEEGVFIWVEAGNGRAREIFEYFGFKLVEVLHIGIGICVTGAKAPEGLESFPLFLMTFDPSKRRDEASAYNG